MVYSLYTQSRPFILHPVSQKDAFSSVAAMAGAHSSPVPQSPSLPVRQWLCNQNNFFADGRSRSRIRRDRRIALAGSYTGRLNFLPCSTLDKAVSSQPFNIAIHESTHFV